MSLPSSQAPAPRAGAALPRRVPPGTLGAVLALVLAAIVVASLRVGTSDLSDLGRIGRGLGAMLGLTEPLAGAEQTIVEWRAVRVLCALGVGAALALSGGLLQGVFQNDLASPSIIGVSAGASLGASLGILILGGYATVFGLEAATGFSPLLVTACAFAFALAVAWLVTALATTGGRISVPTLLLVGIAVNATVGGLLAAVHWLALRDELELARALITWTFGTLDDRTPTHAALVWAGLAVAVAALPWVCFELDLFAAGEEDAHGLGVDTGRVKLLALGAASLAAAAAVSVAGQIAFVGLIVPHLLRLVVGPAHRALLPLCLLGGPVLLLGADLLRRVLWGGAELQPGVMMSLLGGPFFLLLLLRNRAGIQSW
ncbi:MAG: iron ABC transporter permease [Planctomycetota bacterium]|jgi:iron complex transport system permease protein|nr:iron ABC transporter permease [Planctomycetota bacterium]MDP6762834.1 iron ABC transporter permease [Planctomycetota bacterium]MDP6988488.1 iron ABC transporter permease [Planctomycetota bacterium]